MSKIRERKRNFLFALLTVLFACILAICIPAWSRSAKRASAFGLAVDVVGDVDDMTLKAGATRPGGDGVTALEFKGRNGASAIFANKAVGVLDMEMLPYGGLKEMQIELADGERRFAIGLQYGSTWQASVEANGQEFGIFYYGSSKSALNQTSYYNGRGEYTVFGDSLGYPDRVKLSFDPVSMQVKVNGILVWDLTKPMNDGRDVGVTYKPFASYSVTVKFLTAESDSRLYLYGLNGQTLGESVILDDAYPRTFIEEGAIGLKGQEYTLPIAHAYDVADGYFAVNEVSVTKEGVQVPVVGGKFTPEQSGNYTVTYTARDEKGFVTRDSQTIEVVREHDYAWELGEEIPATLSQGCIYKLPAAQFITNLERTPVDGTVKLVYGTEEKYVGAGEEDVFFDKTGVYTLTYIPADKKYASLTKSFVVTVDGEATLSSPSLPEDILTGNRITLPEAKIVKGSAEVAAEITVIYPDGASYKNSDVNVEKEGIYTIEYQGEIEGKRYCFTRSFLAKTAPETLFTGDKATLQAGVYPYNASYKGLEVTQKSGGKVTYNKIVDLTGKKYEDVIISALPSCATWGVADYLTLKVTLTDIYDPNNYVTLTLDGGPGVPGPLAHVRAGLPNQIEVGIANENRDSEQIHRSVYGYPLNTSLVAMPFATLGIQPFNTSYDEEEKTIHTTSMQGADIHMVADLTSKQFFAKAFEGFTTNEVYVSIEAGGLSSAEVKYYILEVDGNKLDGAVSDGSAPQISVVPYDEGVYGVKGVFFPLKKATAFDNLGGVLETEVRAYYVADNGTCFDINVKDGGFVPPRTGNYLVEYSATDYSGQRSVKQISLPVVASGGAIELFLAQSSTTATRGSVFTLPEVTVGGGSGQVNVEYAVTAPSGKAVETDKGSFRLMEAGDYVVTFSGVDYIGAKATKELVVTATDVQGVVFENEDVVMPAGLINGSAIVLPLIKAVDYRANEIADADVQISVKYKETTTVLDETRAYIPAVDEDVDSVTVVYSCGDRSVSYELPVVKLNVAVDGKGNKGGLDASKIFYSPDGSVTSSVKTAKNSAGIETSFVALTATESGAKSYMLSNVLSDYFLLEMDTDKKGGFGGFSLRLSPASDLSKVVKITIQRGLNKEGKSVAFTSINDGAPLEMTGTFTDEENLSALYLKYEKESRSFTDELGFNVGTIKKYLDGSPFDGFEGNLITISVEFLDVTAESSLYFKRINNHNLSKAAVDGVAPEASLESLIGGIYKEGDVVSIAKLVAADVLSSTTVTVTVLAPDFTLVSTLDGVVLNDAKEVFHKQFKLEMVGDYHLEYTVKDMFGNTPNVISVDITVRSFDNPIVRLEGKMEASMKLGKTMKLPTVVASDGAGSAEGITVLVSSIDEDNVQTLIEDGIFKPTKKGTYRIRFAVYDQFYNCTSVERYVTVK